MRRTTAAAIVLAVTPLAMTTPVMTVPAFAEINFPISIPQECFEVAQREGVPTMIQNKYQATKAKVKLASLSVSAPGVRDCRAAVRRAQEAMAR